MPLAGEVFELRCLRCVLCGRNRADSVVLSATCASSSCNSAGAQCIPHCRDVLLCTEGWSIVEPTGSSPKGRVTVHDRLQLRAQAG